MGTSAAYVDPGHKIPEKLSSVWLLLGEQKPHSSGIRGVKASHWLRKSGKLSMHLVNASIVALLMWLLFQHNVKEQDRGRYRIKKTK